MTDREALAGYEAEGFVLCRGVVPEEALARARAEILEVGGLLAGKDFPDVDALYAHLKAEAPELTGLLYDACKRMATLSALAYGPGLREALRAVGCAAPASIDVNFRIDSASREKYLFGWHQDYWFSMGSRNGVVAWIPLTDVDEETGGLELISAADFGRRLCRVRPGETFHSYADAVALDEPIPEDKAFPVRPRAGDALLFRFDLLHRSLPVVSPARSRWTLQARFADFSDAEFRGRGFRPASVAKGSVPYLDELRAQAGDAR